MRVHQCFKEITPAAVRDLVKQYDSLLPDDLKELDQQRYIDIPAAVARRKQDPEAAKKKESDTHRNLAEPPYITKDELVTLVKWKLKHGTFRPKLLSLASSNSEEDVRQVSSKAFEIIPDALIAAAPRLKSLHNSVEILTKLKGIGPATASLILSVYDPRDISFFSDPLFKWSSTNIDTSAFCDANMNVQEDKVLPCFNSKWSIRYDRGEYYKLNESVAYWRSCELVPEWRNEKVDEKDCRDISCIDLEKAAWVLARLDAVGEERPGMAGEQKEVLKVKSAGQDTSKMKGSQGGPKQKGKNTPSEKTKDAKKREQEPETDDLDHVKRRLRSSKGSSKAAQSS
ncbi:MAG: hypothetical protein M1831_004284 [Alyxoria varia]|nr:MAG: hypothetical protein M1831_004284 [Alyxoria varia]